MNSHSSISVIIPTRNRLESLNRVLLSIAKQTHVPKEIIIVDSSDNPLTLEQLAVQNRIQIIHSKPSVCLQRNIGIEQSTSDYVFLCDDDIELPEKYLEELLVHLEKHPKTIVVSGLVYEQQNNQWHYAEKKKSFWKLLYASFFGLSVWSEIKKDDFSRNRLTQRFISNYLKKGNRIAKSGWPIVIDYKNPFFSTPVYSLMASLVRKDKIKNVRFESAFYENGIGDNYDFLIEMDSKVTVIPSLKVLHHEEKINRVPNEKAYRHRIHALHFIMLKHQRFQKVHLGYLLWSLIGKSLIFLIKGQLKLVYYNFEAIARILSNHPLYKVDH
ncbi:glycosyltransferase [Flavobacterium sp. IMCC34852]|uniref:Glycosyltransferase n=1 Tax=Flavobacterium rivulicola TaxID=2732161 RepID=A0A7Y3R7H0_9FLAO|nr:glycosyltransferase [Flavobacterium sp. IMCC34852]NNT71330.1 glycosyltransferase [Flavobacterium sp. IMCC34852]